MSSLNLARHWHIPMGHVHGVTILVLLSLVVVVVNVPTFMNEKNLLHFVGLECLCSKVYNHVMYSNSHSFDVMVVTCGWYVWPCVSVIFGA